MEEVSSSPPRASTSFAKGSPGSSDAPQPSPYKVQNTIGSDYKDADDLASDGSVDKSSKRSKLRSLTSRTKVKTRQLLNLDPAGSPAIAGDHGESGPLQSIQNDAAFNPGKLEKWKTFSAGGSADKTREVLQSITTTIAHPKRTIISKVKKTAAGTLSSVQRPHFSHREDLEFLEAHDSLSRAESTKSSRQATSDDNNEDDTATSDCRDKIVALEEHRESIRVAWTTSHIDRVRVVPKEHLKFPDQEAFVERDENGSQVRYRWEKWLGYILIFYTQGFCAQYIDEFDELPFDIDTLRHHVERIVLASAPWQTWAMDVRSVYRWENPTKTGKWLVLYLILWSTEHIMGFLWVYIIYLIAKNRYFPTSVKSLRDSARRALDREGVAYGLGELIDKHGRENWLEPLTDALGPYIQLQLGDIANMLEVFANFYAWKSPAKTASSLFFIVSCLLVSIFTDMKFCMNIFWFVLGLWFFLCWPIASLYPKYRYLVSPFKWMLWDIPTDAEWSFKYLRRQAQLAREEIIKQKIERIHSKELTEADKPTYTGQFTVPGIQIEVDYSNSDDSDEDWESASSTASILDEADIMAFRGRSHSVMGRLIIYSSGIRFSRGLTKKEIWKLSFLEMAEMRKLQGSKFPRLGLTSSDRLEFKSIDGSLVRVESLKERDKAFNSIIGFSNLQWQSLQTGSAKEADEETSDRK